MNPQLIALAFAGLGLFEAMDVSWDRASPLRLRTMMRLTGGLAAVAAVPGPGLAIAFAFSLSLARRHPDLRYRPLGAVLLLLLTPSVVAALTTALVGLDGFLVKGNFAEGWLRETTAPGLGILAIGVIANSWSWRLRVWSEITVAIWAILSVWAMLGGDPWQWAGLALPMSLACSTAIAPRALHARAHIAATAAVLCCVPFFAVQAEAGAWTQAAGGRLTILRAMVSGEGPDAPGVRNYSETGLSDDVTLIFNAGQKREGASDKFDGSAGLRVRLWSDEEWVISAETDAGVSPVSMAEAVHLDAANLEGDLKILTGWSGEAAGAPVYVSLEAGARLSGDAGFKPSALLSVSAGIDLNPSLQLNFSAEQVLDADRREPLQAQAGVLWRMDEDIALELGVQAQTAPGQDSQAQAYAGFWLRF